MGAGDDCGGRHYSRGEVLLDNLPYAAMLALGGGIAYLGLPAAAAGWEAAAAAGYVAYGLMGSFWIILFVCPFCPSYGSGMCPCGYGGVAARLRRRRDPALFTRKFMRHIPVLFPLWLVPPALAGWALWREFSWTMAGLLAAFCAVAFVVLPVYARHGCERCPQREACPWMKTGDGPLRDPGTARASGKSRESVPAGRE
ncbi:MAG: hypothetical protein ACYS9X_29470 [Planctomycetota bacterium]